MYYIMGTMYRHAGLGEFAVARQPVGKTKVYFLSGSKDPVQRATTGSIIFGRRSFTGYFKNRVESVTERRLVR